MGVEKAHSTAPIGITEASFHYTDQAFTCNEELLVLANATFDLPLCEKCILANQLVLKACSLS